MGIKNKSRVSSHDPRCLHDTLEQEMGDDHILVGAARAGDSSAFSMLVERHTASIYSLAQHLLGDADEADDATQETFIRAYSRLEAFRGQAAFATWLYRIGLNICRDQLRRRQTQERYTEIKQIDRLGADEYYSADPEQMVLAVENRQLLDRALGELPVSYRTTLLLHDVEGLTINEVAVLMKVPLPTAKSRLRRARMALVILLEEQGLTKIGNASC